MLTVEQKIEIAKVSQYLSTCDIERLGLFGGGIPRNLPRQLYCVRKNVEWLYELDDEDDTLTHTSNYLLSLCYKVAEAQYILSISSGGSVAATTVGVFGINWMIITSGMFANATDYEDERLRNKTYRLYWAERDDYLLSDEWETLEDGGFRILIDGFDSSTMVSKGIYLDFKGQGIPISDSSEGGSWTGDI
jgi:hypothetical protein